ncbi:hypothetical protein ALI144C_36145 [Actinosynnema sp. ALI-1.44]|uniref:hypothetical protein n=1 Tax=Actinosynnema sp. ALI-1.44 TaxID=1933779 RepID=UPI00097C2B1B|nr:hypothetical protein [Actinosynnema sp. ALI-1.44]ONI76121.1 hypothetical protein ALI144C_36145 [Actinosynnema sp. ALI-1.44]
MTTNRRSFLTATAAGVGAFALGAGKAGAASREAASGDVWGVTVDSRVITPSDERVPDTGNDFMSGYGVDRRAATGTELELWIRCLILWDNGTPNVMVTADVHSFSAEMHDQIRAGLAEVGIGGGDFVIAGTHTHCGPTLSDPPHSGILQGLTPEDRECVQAYSDWLVGEVVDFVKYNLEQTPVQCTLDYDFATTAFAGNREGLPDVDHAVPVLTARQTDNGDVVAILFGYACHPVARNLSDKYNSDFPGKAVELLQERYPVATALYLTGAAGDQNPVDSGPGVEERFGQQLADAVASIVDNGGTPVTGPLITDYRLAHLDFDLDQVSRPQLRQLYQRRVNGQLDPANSDPTALLVAQRHARWMLEQIDGDTVPTEVELTLHLWTFNPDNPIRILAMGGEPVVGYSLGYKEEFGGSERLWVAGYAGHVPGYIPTNHYLTDKPGYPSGYNADRPEVAGIGTAAPAYTYPCRLRVGIEEKIDTVVRTMVDGSKPDGLVTRSQTRRR